MKSQTMRWEMLNLTKNAQTHIQTTTIRHMKTQLKTHLEFLVLQNLEPFFSTIG